MRLLETDTATNTSIASATQVASYTADAARHILARVLIDQAAGAGDYIIYAKVQRGGSGSSYVMLPKTTGTAASGETSIGFASIPLPVSSGDVVTIWVDGLAGDTTTPDIITDWYEVDTLRPATADRTLVVDASGRVDVSLIEGTDATDVLGAAQTGDSFARIGAAGAGLTALGDARLANLDAAMSTRLASAGYTTPPTVGAIADQVWDEALAGHLTAGTTGKALSDAGAAGDPWSTDLDAGGYAAGTAGDILLDLQGGTVYATGSTPNTTADLYIRRGDTVAVTIGDLTGLAAGWDVLWVTIKRSEHDADSAAILQVRLNVATPTLPGLIYINGQTPTNAGVAATDAWISDVDAGADTLVLNIKPAASLLLPARGSLYWDVQMLDGTTITSLATGEKTCEIGADITRATS